jgi:hypothetical protein
MLKNMEATVVVVVVVVTVEATMVVMVVMEALEALAVIVLEVVASIDISEAEQHITPGGTLVQVAVDTFPPLIMSLRYPHITCLEHVVVVS